MRLLLDTHALLWAISDSDRLGTAARSALRDNRNELCVSAASAWEIATKFRIGKFPGAELVLQHFDEIVQRLRAADLPITRHTLYARAATRRRTVIRSTACWSRKRRLKD